jgi:hypothetical protein
LVLNNNGLPSKIDIEQQRFTEQNWRCTTAVYQAKLVLYNNGLPSKLVLNNNSLPRKIGIEQQRFTKQNWY